MLRTPDAILKELGSDNIDLTPELLADAANDEAVVAKLVAVCDRAAEKPRAMTAYETNSQSWSPYIFAGSGLPDADRPACRVVPAEANVSRTTYYWGLRLWTCRAFSVRLAGGDAEGFRRRVAVKGRGSELRIT